jgi:hypothetical protein
MVRGRGWLPSRGGLRGALAAFDSLHDTSGIASVAEPCQPTPQSRHARSAIRGPEPGESNHVHRGEREFPARGESPRRISAEGRGALAAFDSLHDTSGIASVAEPCQPTPQSRHARSAIRDPEPGESNHVHRGEREFPARGESPRRISAEGRGALAAFDSFHDTSGIASVAEPCHPTPQSRHARSAIRGPEPVVARPTNSPSTQRREGVPRLRGRGVVRANHATDRREGVPRLRGKPEAHQRRGKGRP